MGTHDGRRRSFHKWRRSYLSTSHWSGEHESYPYMEPHGRYTFLSFRFSGDKATLALASHRYIQCTWLPKPASSALESLVPTDVRLAEGAQRLWMSHFMRFARDL